MRPELVATLPRVALSAFRLALDPLPDALHEAPLLSRHLVEHQNAVAVPVEGGFRPIRRAGE